MVAGRVTEIGTIVAGHVLDAIVLEAVVISVHAIIS